jgi:hypothetical protein
LKDHRPFPINAALETPPRADKGFLCGHFAVLVPAAGVVLFFFLLQKAILYRLFAVIARLMTMPKTVIEKSTYELNAPYREV